MHLFSVISENITVNHILLKTVLFGHFSCRQFGSVFNYFAVIIGPQSCKFGRIMQNNSHYTVQGHSRSLILVPIESPCNFLLVINTNSHPVSYRFQVIADYWSNLHFWQGVPLFTTPVRSEPPKLRTTKFGLKKLETSLYHVVWKCVSKSWTV